MSWGGGGGGGTVLKLMYCRVFKKDVNFLKKCWKYII